MFKLFYLCILSLLSTSALSQTYIININNKLSKSFVVPSIVKNIPKPVLLNDISNIKLDYGVESECNAVGGTTRLMESSSNQYGTWCQATDISLPLTGWSYFEFTSNITGELMYAVVKLNSTNYSGYSKGLNVLANEEFYYDGRYNRIVTSGSTTREVAGGATKAITYGILFNAESGEVYMSRMGDFSFFNNNPVERINPVSILPLNTAYYIGISTVTNGRPVDVSFNFSDYRFPPPELNNN